MSPLTPEFRLAAACAMWPPSAARRQAVTALADQVDWDLFTQVVWRHRIPGLAQDALKAAHIPVPRALTDEASRIALKSLYLAVEACRLDAAFQEAGLPAAFLKGAPLAMEAYGDVGLRHSKDVDMLVAPDRIQDAWTILEAQGYTRITPPAELSPDQLKLFLKLSKDSLLRHEGRQQEIELHTRLADDPSGPPTPPQSTWRRVPVGETWVTTFSETDRFLYLCSHGSGHAWMRLKWLADISALIAAKPDSLDVFWQAAVVSRQAMAVEVALRLCGELLGSPLPSALMSAPRWRVRALMNLSMKALTEGDGVVELSHTGLGHMAEPLAGLLLAETPGAAMSLIFKAMISLEDVLLVRLPGPLHFLYPVLRIPLWIGKTLGRYGRRGAA